MARINKDMKWFIWGGVIVIGVILSVVLVRKFSTVTSVAKDDFNGDGKHDLVWQNQATSQIGVWFLNGTNLISANPFDPGQAPDSNWKIVGTGDFNSDGKPDLVWQNQVTSQIGVWLMDGTTRSSVNSFDPGQAPDPNWTIAGVGDFSSDGKLDLVWQNQVTSQIGVWSMNGTTRSSVNSFDPGQAPDPNWKIVGTSDFNNDSKLDLVWQNQATSQIGVWLMDGITRSSVHSFDPGQAPDPNWKIVGTGDFNSDGKLDLVWQNQATSQIGVWLMEGTTRSSVNSFDPGQAPDANWKIASAWILFK